MTTSNPIIRIVDDEAVVRKALKFLLESEGWTVEAYEKGSEFLIEDRPSLIGCLILDVAMPEMNGLELYRRLRERNYEVPVIFLTGHGDVDMADGAIDFIQKPINEERLLSAVAKAVRYDESHRGWTISAEEEKKRYQTLTAREKQILSLIAKGLINKEVSERLGLSPRTIEVHRQKGLHKLGVQTVSELVRLLSHIEENALS